MQRHKVIFLSHQLRVLLRVYPIIYVALLMGWIWLGSAVAQDSTDLRIFEPQEAVISFEYPASWIVREEGQVIALASDESVLPLPLDQELSRGQFKILLVYLTANQRQQANIRGDNLDAILQSLIQSANLETSSEEYRRYEFNRRLTLRADFSDEVNQGSAWVMEMPNDAIVLMQVVTASNEFAQIEGQIIEVLRSLDFSTITQYINGISEFSRPLRFNPQQTRLVFDYPEGWEAEEPNNTTVTLNNGQALISLQFFDYTDLSLQGIPIDDPTSTLFSLQSRSQRPQTFNPVQQAIVNGETYPYSPMQGDNFVGISLGRDIKIGFLWVTVLTRDDTVSVDLNTFAWALLLTTQFRPDPVELTARVIMPQHQFEFFHPSDWLIREVTPSSYLLGTSEAMIDDIPDNLQFTDEAQLLVQYVPQQEYTVARANSDNPAEVLQKFIFSASDLTTYDTPRTLTLGEFEFAQVDFDNPNYSGTALLAPMTDGGAVWIQLRTPPTELGDWEPIALAIARNSRIVQLDTIDSNPLEDAIFDALGVEPTPIPTPTRRPDAPPDLGDVISEVVATPVPVPLRELQFNLPNLDSTYTTNFSEMAVNYPSGWVVQETFPASSTSPSFENSIRISNNANLLLTEQIDMEEGEVEIVVQYTHYTDMNDLGFFGDNLFEVIERVVSAFPETTFEAPLQFRVNGEVMVFVASTTATRQSLSIHKELSHEGYVTVQLIINPQELDRWLPTAIAILQSVSLP